MKSERFTKNSPNYHIIQKNVKLGLGSDECYLKLNRGALKTIEIINSKEKQKTISYEDFDKGFFPWERFQKENTNYPKRK